MKVSLAARARRDLAAIGTWIAQDDPVRARSYVNEILDACAELAQFPRAFRALAHHSRHDIRQRGFDDYLILYKVGDRQITVLAIVHGARDLAAIVPTL